MCDGAIRSRYRRRQGLDARSVSRSPGTASQRGTPIAGNASAPPPNDAGRAPHHDGAQLIIRHGERP